MSCMILFAQPTMATTQFSQAACEEITELCPVTLKSERKLPLSMSWVVVTDENGNRQLRMCWSAEPGT
ncbi:MAG: hypothetical protein JOZ80_10085 [Acidobacteriaceae bacterium]|nr:hypothetical protein [Acidobacteriaceae bacterium]